MKYNNIRYNYFRNILTSSIFNKDRGKLIFIFNIPSSFSPDKKKSLISFLSENGFLLNSVQTNYIYKFLISINSCKSILPLIHGPLLVGTINVKLLNSKVLSRLVKGLSLDPSVILHNGGLFFYPSFTKKIDILIPEKQALKLVSSIYSPLVSLLGLLSYRTKHC